METDRLLSHLQLYLHSVSAGLSKWRPLEVILYILWKWVSDPLGGKSWVQGKGQKCFMLHHLASTNLPMTFRALLDPIGESINDPSSGKDTLMRRSELLKTNISVLKFSVVISDKVLMLLTLHSSLDTSNQICFSGSPFQVQLLGARTYFLHNETGEENVFPFSSLSLTRTQGGSKAQDFNS